MPRKTPADGDRLVFAVRASMRPRPDAAENSTSPASPSRILRGFNEAAARCRGKRCDAGLRRGGRDASMRPRPDAAENVPRPPHGRDVHPGFNEAAARCRGKPPNTCSPKPRRPCFNEAAARCRGKHGGLGARGRDVRASMRPRPDAAENRVRWRYPTSAGTASMRPRPDAAENAIERQQREDHRLLVASMRPRPDAAENFRRAGGAGNQG